MLQWTVNVLEQVKKIESLRRETEGIKKNQMKILALKNNNWTFETQWTDSMNERTEGGRISELEDSSIYYPVLSNKDNLTGKN